jgi:anti-sigma regulatory factor (Ser/Thr protein kinase)
MMDPPGDREPILSVRLPADPQSVRAARDAMHALGGYLAARPLDDVRLLVSELTTNSLRHGSLPANSRICVSVDLQDRFLTVEVQDAGQGFSVRGRSQPSASGWGLSLLEKLASDWGVSSNGCTRVWFTVPTRSSLDRHHARQQA